MIDAILQILSKIFSIFEKKTPTFKESQKLEIQKEKEAQDHKIDVWVDSK